jgi:hypothetical protein
MKHTKGHERVQKFTEKHAKKDGQPACEKEHYLNPRLGTSQEIGGQTCSIEKVKSFADKGGQTLALRATTSMTSRCTSGLPPILYLVNTRIYLCRVV